MRFLSFGLLMLVVSGCSSAAPEEMTLPPPVVSVSYPLERDVTDHAEFTGRTVAVESVKIRARVWGHLQKINFEEGAEVKKGDVLFVLDQRPYMATLTRARAEVAQAEARYRRLENDVTRARSLMQTRAISREEFEKISGELSEVQAAVRSATAASEIAKLNYEYTEVRSPIDGQISRALVTVGNLVESGEMGGTVLTSVVSLDPMYVYFDVDDITYMQIKPLVVRTRKTSDTRLAASASERGPSAKGPPVYLGLANEQGYPHAGIIDFLDNQVDPGTGTLKMRGVLRNGDRSLAPGLFARVRVPLGDSHRAILVTDRAVETDQGQKVVYAVNKDNLVEKRAVRLGRLHDGLREILSGIQPGERIVVDGLLRVRPGMPCDPKPVEMPVFRPVNGQKVAQG